MTAEKEETHDPTPAKTHLEEMLKMVRKFPIKSKVIRPQRVEYEAFTPTITKYRV